MLNSSHVSPARRKRSGKRAIRLPPSQLASLRLGSWTRSECDCVGERRRLSNRWRQVGALAGAFLAFCKFAWRPDELLGFFRFSPQTRQSSENSKHCSIHLVAHGVEQNCWQNDQAKQEVEQVCLVHADAKMSAANFLVLSPAWIRWRLRRWQTWRSLAFVATSRKGLALQASRRNL